MSEQQTYNLAKLSDDPNLTYELQTQANAIVPISMKGLSALAKSGGIDASPIDLLKFATIALSHGANPYADECGLMVSQGKVKVWIAAQVRMRKAMAQSDYAGFAWGWITSDMTRHEPGRASKANPDDVVGAWGEVYRKDREPFYHEVFLKEFQKQSKSGLGKWETSPITMLAKVIRDQAHKFAYADAMGNLNTIDELRAYNEPTLEVPKCDTPPRSERRKPIEATVTGALPSSVTESTDAEPPADMDGSTDAEADGSPLVDGEADEQAAAPPPQPDANTVRVALKGVYNAFCEALSLDPKSNPAQAAFKEVAADALQCPLADVQKSDQWTMDMVLKVKKHIESFQSAEGE